jgi:anti-sigma28 factor (negative regulator of flagellin synthesis)
VCSRQGLDLARSSASGRKDLLDEERLETIRKKIADGFYNRNDVQLSIADRLAHSLAGGCDGEEEGGTSGGDS